MKDKIDRKPVKKKRVGATASQMRQLETVQMWSKLNPPMVVGRSFAKVIQAKLTNPEQVLEMKVDNRYKDGNIKIVKSVVRGNKNTISIEYAQPPKTLLEESEDKNRSKTSKETR